jgi:putative ATP-dependent endonuclease of the OLD family
VRLWHVQIERFRGIKQLDWTVGGTFVCLIGPGDSTKTTILDAIDLALSPRWNVPFDDADFFESKTDEPLSIIVTVGDLPDELKSDAKYGLLVRGWSSTDGLHDEPQDGDELVLSIRLQVDRSLEPSWTVFNDREPTGRLVGGRDRERLGCTRLGEYLDRHFAWGRGSILSRMTEEGDSLSEMLAEANRAARAKLTNLGPEDLTKLRSAAEKVKIAGAKLGVAPRGDYRPSLDVKAVTVGEGGLSLHDGDVPVRRAGLGSRRLLAMAMQREVVRSRGLMLIDEIEHGLEPHRIRRVLQILHKASDSEETGNVLLTTHAPVVIQELKVETLRVVRSKNGITQVIAIPDALQPIVIKTSEAFLARKIIVCEGKTEIGFCRRLDRHWAETGPSFGLAGIALADGGGGEAPKIAKSFAQLGYEVALLADSDTPLQPDRQTLESAGVIVLLWEEGVALEQRIALDLPWIGVAEVVELAMRQWDEQSVHDAVRTRLGVGNPSLQGNPIDWIQEAPEDELRKAIGLAAKEARDGKGWFKRVGLSEELSSVMLRHLAALRVTDLGRKIAALRQWSHGNG